jgi:5-methylthioadenosine/S-adenosylhomocysteine deaminase
MGNMRNRKRFLALALPFFALRLLAQSSADNVALHGTLVTPGGIIEKGTVLIREGKIVASGAKVKLPANVTSIEVNGIIAPGLVDLHNHLTWNVFPRWHPNQEFGSRYDWQKKDIYQTLLESPHASMVTDGLECEMERYAEVKAVSEGETSAVGSLADACSQGLAHNLDTEDEFQVAYNVFPLRMTDAETASMRQKLQNHQLHAFLIHLCEGSHTDASSAHEFAVLKERGLLIPGVAIIHGVALQPENFTEMAANGVSLIWSPRSNLELYGNTAAVAAAKAAKVPIALSPDWSPTGSDGLLAELNYAAAWNETQKPRPFTDRELFAMATTVPAAIVGLSHRLGAIEPGHDADLIVIHPNATGAKHDAWWNLTHATAAQVSLVMIDGDPVWGDPDLLEKLSPSHPAEKVEVCGTTKAVLFTGLHGRVDEADETWAHTTATLETALRQFGRNLAPLAECGQ